MGPSAGEVPINAVGTRRIAGGRPFAHGLTVGSIGPTLAEQSSVE